VEKASDKICVFKPSAGSKDSMMAKFKKQDYKDMVCAYNKPPRWNDTVGAFVLNFNGRVTMASVKNFQLITHDDLETVILQFGRVAKEEFTMDVRWPMSPFQVGAAGGGGCPWCVCGCGQCMRGCWCCVCVGGGGRLRALSGGAYSVPQRSVKVLAALMLRLY